MEKQEINLNEEKIVAENTEKKEQKREKTSVVLDTNILMSIAENTENLDMLPKVLEIIVGEKLGDIIITSGVYYEVELLKKSGKCSEAKKVYSWLGKVLYEGKEPYKYIELPKHPDGVDDSIINFAIENGYSFISLDIRSNIRYFNKIDRQPNIKLNDNKFKKIIQISRHFDNLTEENLHIYLQKLFDSGKTNPLEYIQFNSRERIVELIKFLVEEYLKDEDEEFLDKIEKTVLEMKKGEISNKILI